MIKDNSLPDKKIEEAAEDIKDKSLPPVGTIIIKAVVHISGGSREIRRKLRTEQTVRGGYMFRANNGVSLFTKLPDQWVCGNVDGKGLICFCNQKLDYEAQNAFEITRHTQNGKSVIVEPFNITDEVLLDYYQVDVV